MIARLTALMTLNAAMWDYRNTPARAAMALAGQPSKLPLVH
jgi:hypothetical protein